MLHIALYEPEIPPNTGNIIRLCANLGYQLHLIGKLGFVMDDKRLRRAGLDYAEWSSVEQHRDYAAFVSKVQPKRVLGFTTKAEQRLFDVAFVEGDVLLFGPETRGLPAEILASLGQTQCVRIPMQAHSRSLNLSNAVAIASYEAWRQLDYAGGC